MSRELHTGRPALTRGFTLIELMVVVLMIGIMVAMVIPDMRGTMEDASLRSTVRKIVVAMNVAHSQAITTGRPHRMSLDLGNSRFAIERKTTGEDRAMGFVAMDGSPGSTGELDPRIRVQVVRIGDDEAGKEGTLEQEASSLDRGESGANEAITFESDGTADPVEIIVRDRQGFGLAIRLNPVTSRVRILDRPHE